MVGALEEGVLLYPVYALLFADTGLTTAQISSLFAIWSVVSFVCEIPAGALADVWFRKRLYALGQALSNYAPPGTDPDADLTQWFAAINAGEPYDQNPLSQDIVDEITSHHSSYYIDDSTPPAPMLISNGWTDDLFPPDEAIRFYNRTNAEHPDADISLYFLDYGHMRGTNKGADVALDALRMADLLERLPRGGRA